MAEVADTQGTPDDATAGPSAETLLATLPTGVGIIVPPPEPADPADMLWARWKGEPNLWYTRFQEYRLAGPERSLLALYNTVRARKGTRKARKQPSGTWKKVANAFKWHTRAEAWDEAERQRQEREARVATDALFEHSLQATKLAYQKLTDRLAAMAPDELESRYVIPQFLALLKKLEEQYGRSPAQRVELTGKDGAPIQVDVTARRHLLERAHQLAEQIRAGLVGGAEAGVTPDEHDDSGAPDESA